MPTQKLFKRRVRERMSKTGESYTTARSHLARTRDRLASSRTDLVGALELASDEKVSEATGRGWKAWLFVLDRWGARQRKRGETVDFLMAEHAVRPWYAQAIATGYERVRGLRLKHQQADGFTIYASKTVSVPLDVLFAAFVDERRRDQWLADGSMSVRTSQPGKVAHFDWDDGATRVNVTFEEKGPAKSTAFVTHERLADPDAAEAAKAAWRQRLAALKAYLESTDV
jgi:uncharacterized protein YndB with AHSA1/START domain